MAKELVPILGEYIILTSLYSFTVSHLGSIESIYHTNWPKHITRFEKLYSFSPFKFATTCHLVSAHLANNIHSHSDLSEWTIANSRHFCRFVRDNKYSQVQL